MVKSIIKRIIVGVGIALVLMALKGQLLLDVHADSVNVNPDKICAITGTGDSCSFTNVTTYQVYERPMYGNTFGANVTRGRIIWHFTGNNIKGKTYDIDFLLFLQGSSSDLMPNRGYIQNGKDNVFTCDIDNTRWGVVFNGSSGSTSASVDGTAMVHCNNVNLDENYFTFYLFDIATKSSGVMAVSHATLSENVNTAIKDKIEDVNDSINDDSVDNSKAESDIGNMKNKVASNGSITQLLTLPITLYQSVLNNANGSCAPFDMGVLFGHSLQLPCITPQVYLGQSVWHIIDMLCSGLFILSFRKKMVDIFNHITSLNDRGNELE